MLAARRPDRPTGAAAAPAARSAPSRRLAAASPRGTLLRLALAAAALLAAPAAAQAELPWTACSPAGFQCARTDVPLDRSGATPGTVTLNATRATAASNPGRSAVVALAGGPGQAAVPLARDFAASLGPALAERDLLVFDQRGTGGSGALSCPALSGSGTIASIARRCAEQIGATRGLYRTPDSAEDLEALRAAAGYDRLVIYGVSYGTKVAMAYAAAHPDRVEALVLDSVVLPDGPDPFRRSSLSAVRRVLTELCAGGACRAATPSVGRDLAALARRLRRGALRGTVIDGRGRRNRASIRQAGLFSVLLAGDLNPTLRAELPGAMRAALRGDRAPLLRLSARSSGLDNGAQSAVADSDALFLATTCEETAFAWTRGASVQQRAQEIDAVARTIPAAALGPFSSSIAVQGGVIPLCVGWPVASPAPAAPGALPQVRTLVLDGRMDLRTPVEDAQRVAALIPGAQVVDVPFTGHSVLGSDFSDCSKNAVAAFFGGGSAAPCGAVENSFSPTPRPPTRLRDLAGRDKRRAAAAATVLDARRQVIGEALAVGRVPGRVGGLRGGYVTTPGGGFRLVRYEYVPGVTVTGTATARGAGSFRLGGRAGLRGSVRLSAAAGGPGLPTPAEVARLPRQ
ncbi:MAG: alpha/beta fold hydrolase [Solirubrobacterales bacterium]|nr:alpha/beta fold hydrolase [Solirubrobacterales bacterium]